MHKKEEIGIIIFQLSTIVYTLIKNTRESLYCIPIYIIQFLALMIHLEILELNFYGLNKYTTGNIELRGLIDFLNKERNPTVDMDKIDINNDYFVDGYEKNERTTEMEERLVSFVETPINNNPIS